MLESGHKQEKRSGNVKSAYKPFNLELNQTQRAPKEPPEGPAHPSAHGRGAMKLVYWGQIYFKGVKSDGAGVASRRE